MTLKVTQGHRNCLYSMGHINHFQLVSCSNDSNLRRFWDINTFTCTWLIVTLRSPSFSKR